MDKSAPSCSPEKTLKNVLVKISAVLFCPNGAVFLMGPLPHMTDVILFCVRTGGPRPSPTTFTLLATQRDSAKQRTVELIRKRMQPPPLQEKPLRDPFDSARMRRAPLRMTQGEKRRISR